MKIALLMFALAFAGGVRAADYVAAPGSTLGFRGSLQGEAFDGRFARFTPRIRFDPAHPELARFDVAIDLASANTDNEERDGMLRGPEFFATQRQPQARFVATRVRALGNGRFAADGTLSLRGVSKPVTLAFRWTPGPRPVLDGQASLKRLDFGVGSGEWADTTDLADAVQVTTHLVLQAAPAAKAMPAKANAPAR